MNIALSQDGSDKNYDFPANHVTNPSPANCVITSYALYESDGATLFSDSKLSMDTSGQLTVQANNLWGPLTFKVKICTGANCKFTLDFDINVRCEQSSVTLNQPSAAIENPQTYIIQGN